MIDIQTLTINSHVLFNGERVEICTLDALNGYIGIKEHYTIDANDRKFAVAHTPDDFSPIPITEELLTELPNWRVAKYSWTETILCYWKVKDDLECCVGIYNGHCEVSLMKKDCEHNNIVIAQMRLRYLHELEAFVYLTTKQRLI